MKKTNVLCIMDGFGHNPSDYGNAIAAAKKPNLDMLMEKYPYTIHRQLVKKLKIVLLGEREAMVVAQFA